MKSFYVLIIVYGCKFTKNTWNKQIIYKINSLNKVILLLCGYTNKLLPFSYTQLAINQVDNSFSPADLDILGFWDLGILVFL